MPLMKAAKKAIILIGSSICIAIAIASFKYTNERSNYENDGEHNVSSLKKSQVDDYDGLADTGFIDQQLLLTEGESENVTFQTCKSFIHDPDELSDKEFELSKELKSRFDSLNISKFMDLTLELHDIFSSEEKVRSMLESFDNNFSFLKDKWRAFCPQNRFVINFNLLFDLRQASQNEKLDLIKEWMNLYISKGWAVTPKEQMALLLYLRFIENDVFLKKVIQRFANITTSHDEFITVAIVFRFLTAAVEDTYSEYIRPEHIGEESYQSETYETEGTQTVYDDENRDYVKKIIWDDSELRFISQLYKQLKAPREMDWMLYAHLIHRTMVDYNLSPNGFSLERFFNEFKQTVEDEQKKPTQSISEASDKKLYDGSLYLAELPDELFWASVLPKWLKLIDHSEPWISNEDKSNLLFQYVEFVEKQPNTETLLWILLENFYSLELSVIESTIERMKDLTNDKKRLLTYLYERAKSVGDSASQIGRLKDLLALTPNNMKLNTELYNLMRDNNVLELSDIDRYISLLEANDLEGEYAMQLSGVLHNRGGIENKNKNFAQAQSDYLASFNKDPNVYALAWLGTSTSLTNDPESYIATFENNINEVGVSLEALNTEYQQTGELQYSNEFVDATINSYLHYGNALESSGDIAASIEVYKEIIEFDVSDHTARNNLANIYRRRGDFDKAKTLYTESIAQSDDSFYPMKNMAIMYLQQGDQESALAMIEDANLMNETFGNSSTRLVTSLIKTTVNGVDREQFWEEFNQNFDELDTEYTVAYTLDSLAEIAKENNDSEFASFYEEVRNRIWR